MAFTQQDKDYLAARFDTVEEKFACVEQKIERAKAEDRVAMVEAISEAVVAHKEHCGAHQAYRRVKIWMVLAFLTGGGLIVALIKWLPQLWQEGVTK